MWFQTCPEVFQEGDIDRNILGKSSEFPNGVLGIPKRFPSKSQDITRSSYFWHVITFWPQNTTKKKMLFSDSYERSRRAVRGKKLIRTRRVFFVKMSKHFKHVKILGHRHPGLDADVQKFQKSSKTKAHAHIPRKPKKKYPKTSRKNSKKSLQPRTKIIGFVFRFFRDFFRGFLVHFMAFRWVCGGSGGSWDRFG